MQNLSLAVRDQDPQVYTRQIMLVKQQPTMYANCCHTNSVTIITKISCIQLQWKYDNVTATYLLLVQQKLSGRKPEIVMK